MAESIRSPKSSKNDKTSQAKMRLMIAPNQSGGHHQTSEVSQGLSRRRERLEIDRIDR